MSKSVSSGGQRPNSVQSADEQRIVASVHLRCPDQERDVSFTGSQLFCAERVPVAILRGKVKDAGSRVLTINHEEVGPHAGVEAGDSSMEAWLETDRDFTDQTTQYPRMSGV